MNEVNGGYYTEHYNFNCQRCSSQMITWDLALKNAVDDEIILQKYFTNQLHLSCLESESSGCHEFKKERYAEWLINAILNKDISDIFDYIEQANIRTEVRKDNIPQFSNIEASLQLVRILCNLSPMELSFIECGKMLVNLRKKAGAHNKYGENHSKLLALLDLATIKYYGHKASVTSSKLSFAFVKLSDFEKNHVLTKLVLRIPIIQELLLLARDESIDLEMYLNTFLATTTAKRRKSNIIELLTRLKSMGSESIAERIKNIY